MPGKFCARCQTLEIIESQIGLALARLYLPASRSSSAHGYVSACRDIAYGNGWLVACSLVHMGLVVVLVRSHGAVGLIAADAANMVLRIAFCLVSVARHFRDVESFQLKDLFPSRAALSALAAASLVCLAADNVLFKGTALPKSLQVCTVSSVRSPFLNPFPCCR